MRNITTRKMPLTKSLATLVAVIGLTGMPAQAQATPVDEWAKNCKQLGKTGAWVCSNIAGFKECVVYKGEATCYGSAAGRVDSLPSTTSVTSSPPSMTTERPAQATRP